MIRKLMIVTLGAFLISTAALAGNFYIGASVGQTNIELSDSGLDFNADDSGYKIFGGYRFLKFFGVEGSYVDLGAPSDDVGGGVDVEIDVTAWDAFAVGVIPMGPFEIFGKAGYVKWDSDVTVAFVPGSDSDSGNDPAYGVGVAFHLGKLFGIRAEYERFDIQDTDKVDVGSVGAEFRF